MKLKNQKSHGGDGIPGDLYKTLKEWVTEDIRQILKRIKHGHKIPETWTQGIAVHIYKQKGNIQECNSYRPICLTKVIYKIWPQLLTNKLAKILHTITGKIQYGYKSQLSTIEAILKVEEHMGKATPTEKALLMGQSKAFGAINRTMLWATLYKKRASCKPNFTYKKRTRGRATQNKTTRT